MNAHTPALLGCLALAALAGCAATTTSPSMKNSPSQNRNAWKTLAPLPDPIGFGGLMAGVIDDQLVAAGGSQWDKPVWAGGKRLLSDRIFVLESIDGKWREHSSRLPQQAGHFAAAEEGGRIFFAGGLGASGTVKSSYQLAKAGAEFRSTPLPDLPEPIVYGAGAVSGGRFYVIGGLPDPSAKPASRRVWSIETKGSAPQWRAEPDLPIGVFVASAAGDANSVYVLGGMTFSAGGALEPSKSVYRLTRGKWEPLADLPEPRVAAASPAPIANGTLYAVGGYATVFPGAAREHPGFSRQTFLYDIAAGRWSNGAVLEHVPPTDRDAAGDVGPAPMIGAPGVVWRNHVVVISGEARAAVRTPAVVALPLDGRR
jgi:N-acetylneuraminic acid mutarotase